MANPTVSIDEDALKERIDRATEVETALAARETLQGTTDNDDERAALEELTEGLDGKLAASFDEMLSYLRRVLNNLKPAEPTE